MCLYRGVRMGACAATDAICAQMALTLAGSPRRVALPASASAGALQSRWAAAIANRSSSLHAHRHTQTSTNANTRDARDARDARIKARKREGMCAAREIRSRTRARQHTGYRATRGIQRCARMRAQAQSVDPGAMRQTRVHLSAVPEGASSLSCAFAWMFNCRCNSCA